MAKSKKASPPMSEREDWEAHDAMHTLMRAGEIVKNKPLLKRVRKKAAEHAEKMQDVANRAGDLARRGLISEKAMAKHMSKGKAANKGNQGGNVKDLDKTAKLASGTEGDGPSTQMRGANYR